MDVFDNNKMFSVLVICVVVCNQQLVGAASVDGANFPMAIKVLSGIKDKLAELLAGSEIYDGEENKPEDDLVPIEDRTQLADTGEQEQLVKDLTDNSVFSKKRKERTQNPFLNLAAVPARLPVDKKKHSILKIVEPPPPELEDEANLKKLEERLHSEEICGCATNHQILDVTNLRVVGGHTAQPNALPWQVFVRILRQYRCGASVINKKFVLSAMHCYHGHVNLDHPGQDILIGAGIHDLCIDTSRVDHGWQVTYVKKIHHHGDYDPSSFNNDIAILELDRDLRLNEHVMPVCLPTKLYDPNTVLFVSGWGHKLNKEVPCELQYLGMPLLPLETCRKSELGQTYKVATGKDLPDKQMCAGHLEGGKDACQGDSGGPLVIARSAGAIEQIGIVSWGIGCAKKNSPGAYVNVFQYLDFIRNIVKSGECSAAATNNNSTTTAPVTHNTPTSTPAQVGTQGNLLDKCRFAAWSGNGYCDDAVNNAECLFDMGDCCQANVTSKKEDWKKYCFECNCKVNK